MRGALKHSTTLIAALALSVFGNAGPVFAQGDRIVRPPNVEVGGGIGYVGQAEAGTKDAVMTSNQPGSDPDPFVFFGTSGKTRSGPVAFFQVGVNFQPAWGFEGGFQYSNPTVGLKITDDVEDAPSLEIALSSFRQYAGEGNVVYHLNRHRYDNRKNVPFLLAGVGVLRQQDDETAVTETARYYQAGFGVKWFANITSRGQARGAGVRLDVRYVYRDGGFDFEEKARRSLLTVSATALFGF